MKRRMISGILTAVLLASLIAVTPALAVSEAPNVRSSNRAEHWFYDQLDSRARNIYNAMYDMYQSGGMTDGRTSYDLAEDNLVSQAEIRAYASGDGTLFDDFAAAKDAFDLEHPEAWYMDSSYLSFRVTQDNSGRYHAWMGPGRTTNYHLNGSVISDVAGKTRALEQAVQEIISGAESAGRAYSGEDRTVRMVQYVHDQITQRISYRYEIDATRGNEDYIRTVYALVTHEGVCESYSRSMQLILNRMGIPCVPIHGMQTSGGDPEPHMWNAVQISNKWYAVDATWDDPVRLDRQGNIKTTGTPGLDGGEIDNYLLVGQDVIGLNWQPSGVVSGSGKEFTYPTIEQRSFDGDDVYQDAVGLHVSYSSAGVMEDEVAGKWTVDFRGDGVTEAAKDGFYFLVKMWDVSADDTHFKMDEWYYVEAGLKASKGNEYFKDTKTGVVLVSASCDYAEFAVTTRRPDGYETWDEQPESGRNELTESRGEAGYYHGDGLDIIAETDWLYNVNSSYAAPPYVKSQYPEANRQVHIGQTYRMQVTYDDKLYAPDKAAARDNWSAPDTAVIGEPIRVSYTTWQPDQDYNTIQVDLAGEVNIDKNHVGCVASTGGGVKWQKHYVDSSLLEWHWACETKHEHVLGVCPVDGVSFDFTASTNWSDDLTLYSFQIEGLVGSRSGKRPNEWGVIMSTPYCPICYRSQGIDWNLWGRPFLLDNPDDLDLDKVKVQGTDGSERSLSDLDSKLNKNGYNGKLTLTVEDISKSRPRSQEVSEALEEKAGVAPDAIKETMMYEIAFTRICKMMVLETGQSVRVSVGYPGNITYEDLKDYVIKAYHFTRDEEGSCDITTPGHEHTGEITSVQELNISATPYGLVILCDSFSPFEIVALDPAKVSRSDKFIQSNSVIVATDGNGAILVDGEPATGANGVVSFSGAARQHTFTVQPKAGYAVDAVSFGGKQVAVTGNSFVLTADEVVDINDVLNVTFVPTSIKAAEGGQNAVVPDIVECGHLHTRVLAPAAPTCTLDGHTGGVECIDCGHVLEAAKAVPATGHTYRNGVCTVCGALESAQSGSAYTVTALNGRNGTLTANLTRAGAGETVVLTAVPDKGYELAGLTVTDRSGRELPLTRTQSGRTAFIMPASPVVAEAFFAPAGQSGTPGDPNVVGRVNLVDGYTDVPADAWYRTALNYVLERRLMDGISGTSFAPVMTTTRAVLAVALYRLEGSPAVESETVFLDVPANSPYADAVRWASANKIVNGYGGGIFGPEDPITREQMAAMLYRYAEYAGYDMSVRNNLGSYTDAASISPYAVEAMRWANAEGLITGTTTTTLSPAGSAERSQAATILMRFCENVAPLEK